MSLRLKLILVSLIAALAISIVTLVFWSTLQNLHSIEGERVELTKVGDAVRDLSIVVNGLDSNQMGAAHTKLKEVTEQTTASFERVSKLKYLPAINDTLKGAMEVIRNMSSLIAGDLAALTANYEKLYQQTTVIYLDAVPIPPTQFYTDEYAKKKYDLTEVYATLESLNSQISSLTETLASVSGSIQEQSAIIDQETAKLRTESISFALSLAATLALLAVGLTLFIGRSINQRVLAVEKSILPLSEGDFSRDIKIIGRDEISRIAVSLNKLLEGLNTMLGVTKTRVAILKEKGQELSSHMIQSTSSIIEINTNIESTQRQLEAQTSAVSITSDAILQLNAMVDALSGLIDEEADILENSSAAVEQMIANVSSVTQNTQKAEESTDLLLRLSQNGKTKLDSVIRSVEAIAQSSANLANATVVINDIAAKTNLLAMNASIEAAHAGESGKGFAVVAHEIRELAAQAATQSRQIAGDLDQVQEAILAIQSISSEAFTAFKEILTQAGKVGDIVREVRAIMQEQNTGGSQVLDGIRQLNSISAQVLEGTAVMKSGEDTIRAKIRELTEINHLVNQNNREINLGTREINASIIQINEMTETNRNLISELEFETNKFIMKEVEQPERVEDSAE